MAGQLGNPHPLRRLAATMAKQHLDLAVAELFDAHLLSYLTRQECRTIEFEPFWSRLAHYRAQVGAEGPRDYVVATHEIDRSLDWINGGWPGKSPPETDRLLWLRLRQAALADPSCVVEREPLVNGYERIRLRQPLHERDADRAVR